MERHFERELESLKTMIIKMGSLVEASLLDALTAVFDGNEDLAQRVVDADQRVNTLEVEIDNAVVDILALKQPVASDLRLILSVQKLNNDLERIGDHAVNIAESALGLEGSLEKEQMLEIPKMAEITRSILRDAIDSFIHLDVKLAQTVLEQDDEVDDLNREMYHEAIAMIKTDSSDVKGPMHLLRISKNLERVADLATNIAEEVIFLKKARIVKHGH